VLDSKSTENNIIVPIQDLIERFARLGPNTDFNIIEQLLSRKDESLPYIIEIAQNDKYWFSDDDGEYSSWTPVCALHLLSVIGGPEAINAFINSIKEYYDDTEDWITEDMPAILANFGIEAFENIQDMLLDKEEEEVDTFVRAGAARALFLISEKYPYTREKSIKALRDAISSENDQIARSCFMYELVHFKDHNSLPFIEIYFKNDMIDDGLMTLDDVLEYYYGNGSDFNSLGNTMAKDSLDIFKDSPNNFYRNSNTGKYLPSTKSNNYQPITKSILKKEVGRNDPCPCGSGKKYKKCCLKIV
jgi:hypothetical protein